jgi:hypothetical protein
MTPVLWPLGSGENLHQKRTLARNLRSIFASSTVAYLAPSGVFAPSPAIRRVLEHRPYKETWPPFAENFQTSGFVGTDADTPTGAEQMQFHTAGLAVFPSRSLVLKATYEKVKNRDPAGANADSFLGAVGFFF